MEKEATLETQEASLPYYTDEHLDMLKKISNFRPDRDYVTVLPEDFMSEQPKIRNFFWEKQMDFSGKGECRAKNYFETDELQKIRRVLSGHKKIHKDFPKICAVCDHTTWTEDLKLIALALMPDVCFEVLKVPNILLPAKIAEYYDISEKVNIASLKSRYSTIMLSPDGLLEDEKQDQVLVVCNSCRSALHQATHKKKMGKKKGPGRFAIANGLYFGKIPNEIFDSIKPIEFLLMAPYHRTGSITAQRGVPGGVLTGHRLSFFLDTQKIVDTFPLLPHECLSKVILTGCFTPAQYLKSMSSHIVDPKNLKKILQVFQDFGNPLYRDVKISEEHLSAYKAGSVHDDFVYKDDFKMLLPGAPAHPASTQILPTGGLNLIHSNKIDEGVHQIFETSSLPQLSAEGEANELLAALKAMCTHVVKSSSNILSVTDPNSLNLNFPQLWPSNVGTFSEHRENPISFPEYVRHCVLVGHGRFRGADFCQTAYNLISRKKLFKKCGLLSSIPLEEGKAAAELYAEIPPADFQKVIDYKLLCQKALKAKTGIPPRPPNYSSPAAHFLENVEKIESVLPHTDESAKRNRNKFFSVTYFRGKPTFWFTFNPNVHLSPIVVHLATGKTFEYMPSAQERYNLLHKSPGSASLYFKHILETVLEDIFGWRKDGKGPTTSQGILPLVEAFCYAVESDGSRSLHCHMLVWLVGGCETFEKFNDYSRCKEHRAPCFSPLSEFSKKKRKPNSFG